jgi:hypothetical protein
MTGDEIPANPSVMNTLCSRISPTHCGICTVPVVHEEFETPISIVVKVKADNIFGSWEEIYQTSS